MEATSWLKDLDGLVRGAISGDRSAFADLLEMESMTAYRASLAILHSPEDARDAVQDAAIIAWQRLPQLRSGSAWPAWFRRIAVRVALDERRRVRRVRDVGWVDSLPEFSADSTDAVTESLTVLAALKQLPADDRAILGLRYGADLAVPDVATALGIRLGTAKARLSRAVHRLRKELDDPIS